MSAVARELAAAPVRTPSRRARPRLHLVAPDKAPARMAWCGARPRLRVVGPDERADRDGRDERLQRVHRQECLATRLSNRGRLVVTLLALAVAVAVLQATSVDAAAPQIDHATAVSVGQTLSEVAAAQLPMLPTRDAVARIQLANGLNSSQVHAGQVLLIPAVP